MKRFVDELVFVMERFAIGNDTKAGQPYLSIPVANRLVNYDEYYRLEPEMYGRFLQDNKAAAQFAEECRQRKHDDRLILQPGADRGTAI